MESVSQRIRVELGGTVVAETTRALRVLEGDHPPVYYVPLEDVAAAALVPAVDSRQTFCEWKGMASYYDVVGGDGTVVARGAWTYLDPTPGFEAIRDAVAFYPAKMERCTVDGEAVTPQASDYYGGWIVGT